MNKLKHTVLKQESSEGELLDIMHKFKLVPSRILPKDELYQIIEQCSNAQNNNNNNYILKAKHKLIGFNIINLQNRDQGGSHWVALYVDPRDPSVGFYFCSFGGFPLKKLEDCFTNGILYYNKNQIQCLDSVACGYYAVGALLSARAGFDEFKHYCNEYFKRGSPKTNEGKLLKYLNSFLV
jgi:hypothetical protein